MARYSERAYERAIFDTSSLGDDLYDPYEWDESVSALRAATYAMIAGGAR